MAKAPNFAGMVGQARGFGDKVRRPRRQLSPDAERSVRCSASPCARPPSRVLLLDPNNTWPGFELPMDRSFVETKPCRRVPRAYGYGGVCPGRASSEALTASDGRTAGHRDGVCITHPIHPRGEENSFAATSSAKPPSAPPSLWERLYCQVANLALRSI